MLFFCFIFYIFKLEFLIGVRSSDPFNAKIPSLLLLLRQTGCVCANRHIFQTNQSPKNVGTIHFMFGGRFGVSQKGEEYGSRKTSANFFYQVKVS
jgi:hypothetical protein